ncbi:MAG TPA: hypothetical protein ENI99_03025 [Sedimenticola sp.]|nr:hypothetical protein [Sedimenticola sp.]
MGLVYNPVVNIRKPAPPQGRNRRLTAEEEQKLLQACDAHIRALKACGRKIGRRVHYPAAEIARIIAGGCET